MKDLEKDLEKPLVYRGTIALCFLVVQNPKNFDVFRKWYSGYEDYINIYAHISGPKYDVSSYKWLPEIWENRVDVYGIEHIPTKWGTVSLVKAEGLIYEAAIQNPENKFFCLLSESDIPIWSFPEFYEYLFRESKNCSKSFMSYNFEGSKSDDMFSDLGCFPSKFIPTTIEYKKKHPSKKNIWNDLRRWTLYSAHQWKILNRRDALEFINMTHNNEYMDSYDKCFTYDPESLAADEYSFANWIINNFGSAELKKRFVNLLTTFVDFDEKAIHALEYDGIDFDLASDICEDKENMGEAMFARKFLPNNDLINKIPLKCPPKKKDFRKKRSLKKKN